MASTVNTIERKRAEQITVAYEHPFVVRLAHWVGAVAVIVMITSGLQIFRAFPSFGPKIPQQNFWVPPRGISLGGWLAGGLQWHFTFMWFFMGSGLLYVIYQIASGNWRQVLFLQRDIKGVWPMVRYYLFFAKKPPVEAAYNPLQKLAYTATIFFGVLSTLTGLVLWKSAQFWWLTWLFGGFTLTRVWHFMSMCGFVLFIPGHLVMVALHGWNNFYSMITGYKRDPEYVEQPPAQLPAPHG